jgi:hypothetical protein
MNFTTESGKLVTIAPADIQALRFIDDGDVFVMYTAGDCDVFLPFNPLTR